MQIKHYISNGFYYEKNKSFCCCINVYFVLNLTLCHSRGLWCIYDDDGHLPKQISFTRWLIVIFNSILFIYLKTGRCSIIALLRPPRWNEFCWTNNWKQLKTFNGHGVYITVLLSSIVKSFFIPSSYKTINTV